MSNYLALARKYRPKSFDEIVGQKEILAALCNSLDTGKIHHAYLLSGTRGVGKTTLARIFAKALNCEQGMSSHPCCQCETCRLIDSGGFTDLIEIDAASRTKVEDTRAILENVTYKPTSGRYKVYLIDEVHMLSAGSFNALLKTLEEPPEHVKFILATTDPQKIPATVVSRCIQLKLQALTVEQIEAQIRKVLELEQVTFDDASVKLIAEAGNGSMRDALSITDQAVALSGDNLRHDAILSMLGRMDRRLYLDLIRSVYEKRSADMYKILDSIDAYTPNYLSMLDDLISLVHQASVFSAIGGAGVSIFTYDMQDLNEISSALSIDTLQLYYQILLNSKRDFLYAPSGRAAMDMALIRLLAFTGGAQSAPRAGNSGRAPVGQIGATARQPTQHLSPVEAARQQISASQNAPAGFQNLAVSQASGQVAPQRPLANSNPNSGGFPHPVQRGGNGAPYQNQNQNQNQNQVASAPGFEPVMPHHSGQTQPQPQPSFSAGANPAQVARNQVVMPSLSELIPGKVEKLVLPTDFEQNQNSGSNQVQNPGLTLGLNSDPGINQNINQSRPRPDESGTGYSIQPVNRKVKSSSERTSEDILREMEELVQAVDPSDIPWDSNFTIIGLPEPRGGKDIASVSNVSPVGQEELARENPTPPSIVIPPDGGAQPPASLSASPEILAEPEELAPATSAQAENFQRQMAQQAKNDDLKSAAGASKAEESKPATDTSKSEVEQPATDASETDEQKSATDASKTVKSKSAVGISKTEGKKPVVEASNTEEPKPVVDVSKTEEPKSAVEASKAEDQKPVVDASKTEDQKPVVETSKTEEPKSVVETSKIDEPKSDTEASKSDDFNSAPVAAPVVVRESVASSANSDVASVAAQSDSSISSSHESVPSEVSAATFEQQPMAGEVNPGDISQAKKTVQDVDSSGPENQNFAAGANQSAVPEDLPSYREQPPAGEMPPPPTDYYPPEESQMPDPTDYGFAEPDAPSGQGGTGEADRLEQLRRAHRITVDNEYMPPEAISYIVGKDPWLDMINSKITDPMLKMMLMRAVMEQQDGRIAIRLDRNTYLAITDAMKSELEKMLDSRIELIVDENVYAASPTGQAHQIYAKIKRQQFRKLNESDAFKQFCSSFGCVPDIEKFHLLRKKKA